MQSTETTFAGLYRCEELATQLISHHASIFFGVILWGMNKPRPWKCLWTSTKKRKKRTKKWKYSSERTSESWRKVEATATMYGIKRSIESRVEKGTVMIVHVLSGWLASSYRGGHWGVPNTAISQKVSTNTVLIPQKNWQISQYRIESRWNTEIAKTSLVCYSHYALQLTRIVWYTYIFISDLHTHTLLLHTLTLLLGFSFVKQVLFCSIYHIYIFIFLVKSCLMRENSNNMLLPWLYNGVQVFFFKPNSCSVRLSSSRLSQSPFLWESKKTTWGRSSLHQAGSVLVTDLKFIRAVIPLSPYAEYLHCK